MALLSRNITSLAAVLVVAAPALGGSHLWRFTEVYSNYDGSIMFIEMQECCGAQNETNLDTKDITSLATGIEWIFGTDIPCNNCTANQHLLLGTQAFADLPGAPTPDYIIPDGLFSTDGDTLTYWLYGDATWTFGAVPTGGQLSLSRDGSTNVNSPTNFAGESGSVEARCNPADLDFSGGVEVGDLLQLLSVWGCTDCDDENLDGNESVGVGDLLLLLAGWGTCS